MSLDKWIIICIHLYRMIQSICAWVLSHFSHVQLFATLWTIVHQAPLSWDSLGKNTGVDGHTLLQGIFPNPGLLHCRQILYLLSPQGRPLGLSLPIFKTGQLDCISKSQSEYAYQSPGILLKCRLLLSRLGVGPETVHF